MYMFDIAIPWLIHVKRGRQMAGRLAPSKFGIRIRPADECHGFQQNDAAKLAQAEATSNTGRIQTALPKATRDSAEDADLDEAIEKMVSEGGPAIDAESPSGGPHGQEPASGER